MASLSRAQPEEYLHRGEERAGKKDYNGAIASNRQTDHAGFRSRRAPARGRWCGRRYNNRSGSRPSSDDVHSPSSADISILLGVFTSVAVLMAAIGTYGVLAYSVAERTREIGIRMALGGRAPQIVTMELRQAAWIIGTGVVLGLVGGLTLSRLLDSLLFEITPTDTATYVSISLLLLMISIIACVIPARRAAAVDPVLALKHE